MESGRILDYLVDISMELSIIPTGDLVDVLDIGPDLRIQLTEICGISPICDYT